MKRSGGTCRIANCDGQEWARRYCAAHLRRIQKHGSSLSHIPIKRRVWGSRLAKTPEFRAWANMRHRCLNPNYIQFYLYGGRGIRICKRWDKFENFLKDMGKIPAPRYSIERINVNKGYSPANCKWIHVSEQPKNRRPRSEWKHRG